MVGQLSQEFGAVKPVYRSPDLIRVFELDTGEVATWSSQLNVAL